MVREVDQLEGAMDGASGESARTERWMVRAVDQGLIGEAMNGASGGSANNRRSDGWCERWIKGLQKERRIAIDGATDGASDGGVIEGAMVAVSD